MEYKRLNTVEIGATIGRWTVVEKSHQTMTGKSRKKQAYWSCRCLCGAVRNVSQHSLRQGTSKSCGCLNREASSIKHTQHGGYKTSEYKTWQAMLSRCRNQNNPRFSQYGGRGISVCDRWLEYETFLKDMGKRPTKSHSLDRINNDEGYKIENCRWSLPHEQMTNRTITRFVEIDGIKVPLATLAKRYKIPANTLRFRILKGWPIEKALTQPVRVKKTADTTL